MIDAEWCGLILLQGIRQNPLLVSSDVMDPVLVAIALGLTIDQSELAIQWAIAHNIFPFPMDLKS